MSTESACCGACRLMDEEWSTNQWGDPTNPETGRAMTSRAGMRRFRARADENSRGRLWACGRIYQAPTLQPDMDATAMAENPALNPETPRRKPGRPSKAEEVRRALAGVGCDPALIDPKRILASIAADADAPAGARVAACRVLLGVKEQDSAEDSAAAASDVATRAIRLMAAARKAH